MKNFSRLLCMILFLGYAALYAEHPKKWDQLSAEEKSAVQFTVEHLFFTNDFVYTLCCDKPVALERMGFKDHCQIPPYNFPFTPEVMGNYIYKGLKTFENVFLSKPLQNYIFLVGQYDPYLQTQDVIFIQRQAFLRVVSDNLSLFQERLGPHITGESLLNAIASRKDTFMNIMRYDDELLGILLGFGKHNAHLFANDESFPDQDLTFLAKEELALIWLPGFIADDKHEETINLKKKYAQQREELTALFSKEDILDFISENLK